MKMLMWYTLVIPITISINVIQRLRDCVFELRIATDVDAIHLVFIEYQYRTKNGQVSCIVDTASFEGMYQESVSA